MKKLLYALVGILMFQTGYSQIEHGGTPFAMKSKSLNAHIPRYTTPAIDLELARSQDAVTDQYKETIYRFGIGHEVDIDFFEMASYETHKGKVIHRLLIECPDAISINFLVDEFYLPEGAEVFVYSPKGKEVKGAFTHENNRENRIFPVGLIGGSRIVIEYTAPVDADGAEFHISQITHGYRSILGYVNSAKGPFGNSGVCNINVNCPEGLPWENQKRTAAIIVDGGALCSGSMVNNVNQDETPFFLTANHCLGNPTTWTYYFNHEASTCTGTTAPINQSISGGTLVASSNSADFKLVELNSNIPASYEPCFAGYDVTDAQNLTNAVSIHHPNGDIKKICFENDSPFHLNVNFNGNPTTAMWYINQWEDGVTEPGSSGSPLFNQDGRVVGVLSGGAAACSGTDNNGQSDYYGRLGVSWNGPNASSRLRDHLDPGNTNTLITDMYCPYDEIFSNDAAGQGISNVPDLICSLDPFFPTYTLKNAGSAELTSATINYTYNGITQTTINWTGNLAQNGTLGISLGQFTPANAANNITVFVSMPNGIPDENTSNNLTITNIETAVSSEANWTVTINTDNFGHETYWEVREVDNGAVIASGGNTDVGPSGGGAETAQAGDPGAYANNSQNIEEVEFTGSGCYEFIIVDDFADGICCGFGVGSYEVVDGGGSTIASGAQFSAFETAARSVLYTSISENAFSQGIELFPNPAEDVLNVNIKSDLGVYDIRILNYLGQIVHAERLNNEGMIQLDLSKIAPGNYMLEVSNESVNGIKRFTLK